MTRKLYNKYKTNRPLPNKHTFYINNKNKNLDFMLINETVRYREYLSILHVRSKYISLSGHQMQYFHEWHSHGRKYNSRCSRVKCISILNEKQTIFLFISCFLVILSYFYLFSPMTSCVLLNGVITS
jgi:hypothetical protein